MTDRESTGTFVFDVGCLECNARRGSQVRNRSSGAHGTIHLRSMALSEVRCLVSQMATLRNLLEDDLSLLLERDCSPKRCFRETSHPTNTDDELFEALGRGIFPMSTSSASRGGTEQLHTILVNRYNNGSVDVLGPSKGPVPGAYRVNYRWLLHRWQSQHFLR